MAINLTRAALERKRIRIIKIQAFIILVLFLALSCVSILLGVHLSRQKSGAAKAELKPTYAEPVVLQAKGPEIALTDLGEFRLTAYCSCVKCCGIWSAEHPARAGTGYIQKTKSGTIPRAGRTVGVDPDVIPLGSVLVINGHEYVAEDTGSAVNEKSIDIYFDSHEDAVNFGVQQQNVYLKGE